MNRRTALPLVLLAVAGLFITGCGNADPDNTVKAITWTLEQVGGKDFEANSTAIKITFSKAVELTDQGDNLNNLIDVIGAASRDGVVSKQGNGKSWLIPIEVNGAGTATVIFDENKRGIVSASKPVVVYKEYEFAPITWTVSCNGDLQNSTNKLVFTFSGDIEEPFFLTSGMIIITPDPDVELKQRGNALVIGAARLGTTYVFEIDVNTSTTGWVQVTIDMDGVDTFPQRLQVILGSNDMFKPPEGSGDATEAVENSGDNVPFTWTVLAIDVLDEESGGGNIVGADLQKIRTAWNRDYHAFDNEMAADPTIKAGYGSFLRIYADVSEVIPAETGDAKLAVGNGLPQQGSGRVPMANYTLQPMQGVPVGPGIVTMDVPLRFVIPDFLPATDDFLFIDAWSGVYIHAVVLYEIASPVKLIRPAKWKKDIAMTGTTDRIGGAGAFFTNYDEEVSWAAPDGAWIEFYVKGSGAGTWGSTGYNWTVGRAGCINLTNGNLITDAEWGRYNKILMADIKASKDTGNLERNTLNPYAGSAFEKVWLCWDE